MISVIIPAYNADKYIKRAIKSVQNQTYKDIEILVINDGSTDNTYTICKSMESLDPRIKVFSKKNAGISSARNYGLDRAEGEYVAFLDSDDEYDGKFLEELYNAIRKSNADMATCGYYSVYENSDKKVSSGTFNIETILNRRETIKELILSTRFSSHPWNKLYNKKIFKQIRYPLGKNYEDMYIMPSIIEECDKIVFVPKRLVYYYQINTSISHVVSLKNECFAFDASYRRFLRYKEEYNFFYNYLVKEPLEIGLKIYTLKKDKGNSIAEYSNIERTLELFLKEHHNNIKAYMKLRPKYKLILFFYPILKNRVKYDK